MVEDASHLGILGLVLSALGLVMVFVYRQTAAAIREAQVASDELSKMLREDHVHLRRFEELEREFQLLRDRVSRSEERLTNLRTRIDACYEREREQQKRYPRDD